MKPVVLPISDEKRWSLANNKVTMSCVSTRILVEHNVRMNVEDLARWQCRTIIWNKMWDKNC
jgi:hypothetical protein